MGNPLIKKLKSLCLDFRQKAEYINAKVLSSDWPATFSKIETTWKKIDNVHALEATFYDEQIERSYQRFFFPDKSNRIAVISGDLHCCYRSFRYGCFYN